MSTPGQPLNHVERTADAVVEDVVNWVRQHPSYQQLVEQLGLDAIKAVAASAGLAL